MDILDYWNGTIELKKVKACEYIIIFNKRGKQTIGKYNSLEAVINFLTSNPRGISKSLQVQMRNTYVYQLLPNFQNWNRQDENEKNYKARLTSITRVNSNKRKKQNNERRFIWVRKEDAKTGEKIKKF